jgi:hypothetical protein
MLLRAMNFRPLLILAMPVVCAGQTGSGSQGAAAPAVPTISGGKQGAAAPAVSTTSGGKTGGYSSIAGVRTTYRILEAGSPKTEFDHIVEKEDWLFAQVTIYLATGKMVWTNHLDAINVTRGRTWMWPVDIGAPPMKSLSQSGVGKPPKGETMIKGIDKGVVGMKRGETRELNIPADEAFGSAGVPGVIPPMSDIKVEITATKLKWKKRTLDAEEAARRLAAASKPAAKAESPKAVPTPPKAAESPPKAVPPPSVPRKMADAPMAQAVQEEPEEEKTLTESKEEQTPTETEKKEDDKKPEEM